MKKGRLEAFSDGVLAIIITIMVLEMDVPEGHRFGDLLEVLPVFLSYLGSFVFIALYWVNHHHLFQSAQKVNTKILWANLNLLFWLSLMPFATAWLGRKGQYNEKAPVILYSLIILISGLSYKLLVYLILKNDGADSALARFLVNDRRGILTGGLNIAAVFLAFVRPFISIIILVLVAASWVIPEKSMNRAFHSAGHKKKQT